MSNQLRVTKFKTKNYFQNKYVRYVFCINFHWEISYIRVTNSENNFNDKYKTADFNRHVGEGIQYWTVQSCNIINKKYIYRDITSTEPLKLYYPLPILLCCINFYHECWKIGESLNFSKIITFGVQKTRFYGSRYGRLPLDRPNGMTVTWH